MSDIIKIPSGDNTFETNLETCIKHLAEVKNFDKEFNEAVYDVWKNPADDEDDEEVYDSYEHDPNYNPSVELPYKDIDEAFDAHNNDPVEFARKCVIAYLRCLTVMEHYEDESKVKELHDLLDSPNCDFIPIWISLGSTFEYIPNERTDLKFKNTLTTNEDKLNAEKEKKQ